jgi:hypothetical protein
MEKLTISMINRDFKGVYESSHTLKGASGYIGALKFSNASKEL